MPKAANAKRFNQKKSCPRAEAQHPETILPKTLTVHETFSEFLETCLRPAAAEAFRAY